MEKEEKICPFLSNTLWSKDESGVESYILKEVPCQKDKCFLYRDNRCGVVEDFDYSKIKEGILEYILNFNENIKAVYDLLRETSEKNILKIEELNNFIKDTKKEVEIKILEFKNLFEESIKSSSEERNLFFEGLTKERNEFMKHFEVVVEKALSLEKEKIENLIKDSEIKISKLFENFEKERAVLNDLISKLKEFNESFILYKEKMEESIKRERQLRKFESAKFLYLKGEFNEAEKILKEILETLELDDAYLLLGLTLIGKRDFDEAEVYLKKYMEKHPEVPEVLSGMGRILFERGEYENALLLLEKAKDKAPQSEDILYLYGLVLARVGDLEGAKKVFERVTELNPYFEPAKEAIRKYIDPLY
ncbi:MAG: tetratricopeptide repeat protein [Candidatus Hydrothermales bacterium]